MISKIRYMDQELYGRFCHWLRAQGTTIGALIKQSGVEQDRKLTEFILSEREDKKNESNQNSI